MLKDWAIRNNKVGAFICAEDVDIYQDIADLNEFENFNSEVERFVCDLRV
jgi:hypothetical protein